MEKQIELRTLNAPSAAFSPAVRTCGWKKGSSAHKFQSRDLKLSLATEQRK